MQSQCVDVAKNRRQNGVNETHVAAAKEVNIEIIHNLLNL